MKTGICFWSYFAQCFLEWEVFQTEVVDKTETRIYLLLTPWCRVLLEKLTGSQLVKKFPAFHGTRRFITAHTSVRHLSLSWASPIQSIYPHPTSWRSVLTLSTHLRLRNTHLMSNNIFFFRKSYRLCDNVEKCCRAGQTTDENTAHAHCMLDAQGHKYWLRLCDTFYSSTSTMAARTLFNVALYVHCLSCFSFILV